MELIGQGGRETKTAWIRSELRPSDSVGEGEVDNCMWFIELMADS